MSLYRAYHEFAWNKDEIKFLRTIIERIRAAYTCYFFFLAIVHGNDSCKLLFLCTIIHTSFTFIITRYLITCAGADHVEKDYVRERNIHE